jgi:hypothetical protein
MLKKLLIFYNRLCSFFKKPQKDLFTIQIKILPNDNIDIDLIYNIDLIKDNDIISTSEKYAELLIYLGTRTFKQDLHNNIQNIIKNSNNVKEQLLLDNVIFFYETIKQHIQSNYSASNSPLIKPSQVFNSK